MFAFEYNLLESDNLNIVLLLKMKIQSLVVINRLLRLVSFGGGGDSFVRRFLNCAIFITSISVKLYRLDEAVLQSVAVEKQQSTVCKTKLNGQSNFGF